MSRSTETSYVCLAADESLRWLPEGLWPGLHNEERGIFSVVIQRGAHSDSGVVGFLPLGGQDPKIFPLDSIRPGFIRPTTDPNRLLVGAEHMLGLLSLDTGSVKPIAHIERHPETMINDGTLLPNGEGAVFGTKHLTCNKPVASFYLWYEDRVTVLKEMETCSNGNIFLQRGDGLELLHIDTPTKSIVHGRLNLELRRYNVVRSAVTFDKLDAYPDGMYGPVHGPHGPSLIVAMFDPEGTGAGQIRQYGIDSGKLEHTWLTPASPQVTCPTLVSVDDGVWLFATTAAENMTAERLVRCRYAGAMFTVRTDFKRKDLPKQPVLQLA